MSPSPTPPAREFIASRLIIAGPLGGAIAAGLNLVLFYAAKAAGVSLTATFQAKAPASALPFWMVVVGSIVPALIATEVLLVMNRFLPRPSRLFARIALVSAALSLNFPAALGGADAQTKITLGLMHLIAAISITVTLLRRGRQPAVVGTSMASGAPRST